MTSQSTIGFIKTILENSFIKFRHITHSYQNITQIPWRCQLHDITQITRRTAIISYSYHSSDINILMTQTTKNDWDTSSPTYYCNSWFFHERFTVSLRRSLSRCVSLTVQSFFKSWARRCAKATLRC